MAHIESIGNRVSVLERPGMDLGINNVPGIPAQVEVSTAMPLYACDHGHEADTEDL